MSLPFRIGVLAVACLAAPLAAQAPDEAARLAEVSRRGELIAAYDRIAWIGTDDMLKRLPDAKNRVGGWIVDGPRDRPTIVFHDRAATPRALYVAQMVGGKLTDPALPEAAAAEVSAERRAMIAARNAATQAIVAAKIAPCSTSFNTVVLPPDAPGAPTRVYFLSALTDMAKVVIGGHHRVEVGADGRAGAPFAFSKGCMTQNRPPKDARSPMLMVTTLTDTIPNETHVFTARSYDLPLVVGVPRDGMAMYAVMPGRGVRKIDVAKAKSGDAK